MYVEDLFLKLYEEIRRGTHSPIFRNLSVWQRNFITDVNGHLQQNKPLSTKQSVVILEIIRNCRDQLVKHRNISETTLEKILSNPQYRRPLYESTNIPKEVRHLGGNLLGFRFKKNDNLKAEVKSLCDIPMTDWLGEWLPVLSGLVHNMVIKPRYDWMYKIWIVPVYRFNILKITNLIATEHFALDGTTKDYMKLARRSADQPSLFAVDEENEILLANVCDNPLLSGWITEVVGGLAL